MTPALRHAAAIETRLRLLGADHLADMSVQGGSADDWEDVCRRLEHETLLLRTAGLSEAETRRLSCFEGDEG